MIYDIWYMICNLWFLINNISYDDIWYKDSISRIYVIYIYIYTCIPVYTYTHAECWRMLELVNLIPDLRSHRCSTVGPEALGFCGASQLQAAPAQDPSPDHSLRLSLWQIRVPHELLTTGSPHAHRDCPVLLNPGGPGDQYLSKWWGDCNSGWLLGCFVMNFAILVSSF